MPSPILPFKSQDFIDQHGQPRTAYACSGWNYPRFHACVILIFERIAAHMILRTQNEDYFQELEEWLDADPMLKLAWNFCLSACRVKPEWVSIAQQEQMLYGDGETPGFLVALSLPEKMKKGGGKPVSISEAVVSTVAALAQSEGSLQKAIELAQQLDLETLQDLLNEQFRLANPKEYQKQQLQAEADQMVSDPASIDPTDLIAVPASNLPPLHVGEPPRVAQNIPQSLKALAKG